MSCAGYSKKSLMGNWYEERLAIPQKIKDDPNSRFLREEEGSIAFMTNNNKLLPLPRHQRIPKWDTSQVVLDDNFKEYRSMMKTNYDPLILTNYQTLGDKRPLTKTEQKPHNYPEFSTSIPTSGPKLPTMLTANNFNKEITDKERDVKMNTTDFGSTFKKHNSEHERFYGMTSYQQSYSKPDTAMPQEYVQNKLDKTNKFAGYTARPEEDKGIRMNSALTGEQYRVSQDPQNNTSIQRSWLPYQENSLKVAEKNIEFNTMRNSSVGMKASGPLTNYRQNLSQVLPYDIATSLPMENGVYNLKSKYMEPGAFRKIRTDVTIIKNKPLTKKQDNQTYWSIYNAMFC